MAGSTSTKYGRMSSGTGRLNCKLQSSIFSIVTCQMSQLDVLVVADLRRAFDARSFEPRALMFCLLADFWLSQLVLGPIIILTYRGAWMSWDYMGAMLIGCGLRQSVLTAILGVAFMFVLSLVHGHLAERLKYDGSHPWHSKDRMKFVLWSRLFIFLSMTCETLLWKGIWELLTLAPFLAHWSARLAVFAVTAAGLMALNSFNVCLASPLGTGFHVDVDRYYLSIGMAFLSDFDYSFQRKVINALFTVCLSMASVITYHSLWSLFEIFLDGSKISRNYFDIFLVALIFSMANFLLQFFNLYLHSLKIGEHWKFMSHEVILVITLVSDVAVFYVYWNIFDEAMMKVFSPSAENEDDATFQPLEEKWNDKEAKCRDYLAEYSTIYMWETALHIGGFLLLALLRISCTVGAGVIREANRYSEGIMIPRYYLTYFLSRRVDPKVD